MRKWQNGIVYPLRSYYLWLMQKTFQAENESSDKLEKKCSFWGITVRVSIVPLGSLDNDFWQHKPAKIDICSVKPAHDSSLVAQLHQNQMPFIVFVVAPSTNINSLC